MKRLTALVSATVVLLTLTACSSGTSGFRMPNTGSTSSAGGASSSNSSDTGTAGGKIASATQLANTNACSLLTAGEAAQVSLPSSGQQDNAGAKSGCEWSGDQWDAIVGIRTDVGLSGVLANGGTIVDTTIGSHQAKKLAQGATGCLYAIGVSNSIRVDIQSGPVGTGDPCQESLAIAQLIEPKLP